MPALAVLWLLFFYTYCLRVWFALGRAPVSIAEHGGLDGSWHHRAAWLLLGPLVYGTIVWSAAVIIGAAFSRALCRPWVFISVAVPWLLWIFVRHVDPGGWFAWFLD